MEPWEEEEDSKIVDAIEKGKIVRVSQKYALKEGLPILRKPKTLDTLFQRKSKEKEKQKIGFEELRKPLLKNKNQVLSELIDNFQWHISRKRRQYGMTRRQLAKAINESEDTIKLIENGILPSNDFVIINKIQEYLNINLRKDQKDFIHSPRKLIEKSSNESKKLSEKKDISKDDTSEKIEGDEIELLEDFFVEDNNK